MRPRRLSASCDGLATSSAWRSSSMSRWRRYDAKNAIWSVPAMSTRRAWLIASIAASTSRRLTRRAVSSPLTWSAATAVSNSLWSSENSGAALDGPWPFWVGSPAAMLRRNSSRAAACSSGKPSKPSAWEKRTTVELDVLARRASSSAVWKATSSRWSTMYWATSFCERENSSKRACTYAERVWWPPASCGACAVGDPVRFMGRPAIRRRRRAFLQPHCPENATRPARRRTRQVRSADSGRHDRLGGEGRGGGMCAESDPSRCNQALPRNPAPAHASGHHGCPQALRRTADHQSDDERRPDTARLARGAL